MQLGYGRVGSDGVNAAWGSLERLWVVHGAKDRTFRPEMSRRLLALHPRASLSIYEQLGHAPFYDEPDRFNRSLGHFAA